MFYVRNVLSKQSGEVVCLTQTYIVGYVLCSRAHDLCVRPGPQETFDTIWRLSNVGNHTT